MQPCIHKPFYSKPVCCITHRIPKVSSSKSMRTFHTPTQNPLLRTRYLINLATICFWRIFISLLLLGVFCQTLRPRLTFFPKEFPPISAHCNGIVYSPFCFHGSRTKSFDSAQQLQFALLFRPLQRLSRRRKLPPFPYVLVRCHACRCTIDGRRADEYNINK